MTPNIEQVATACAEELWMLSRPSIGFDGLKEIFTRHLTTHTQSLEVVARVHGNGFIQVDLNKSKRLHVFGDDRIPRQKVSTQIHDHTFGFTSTVLSGTLVNILYEVKPDPSGTFKVYKAFVRDREDTVLRDTGQRVSVTETERVTIRTGESYSMKPGEFHESLPQGRVVTIIEKDGLTLSQGGQSPTVLVPVGVEPDNKFNRYSLSQKELWAIITSTNTQSLEEENKRLREALQLAISKYPEIAKGMADSVNKQRMDAAFEKIGQTMPHDSPLD